MIHRVAGRRLGRTSAPRKALLRNLVASLIEHERIRTTEAKAKEARPFAESLVTLAKKGTLHHRRQALSKLPRKSIVKKLFDELGPRFETRNGGYTRITKIGFRKGDAAPIVQLEFVE